MIANIQTEYKYWLFNDTRFYLRTFTDLEELVDICILNEVSRSADTEAAAVPKKTALQTVTRIWSIRRKVLHSNYRIEYFPTFLEK